MHNVTVDVNRPYFYEVGAYVYWLHHKAERLYNIAYYAFVNIHGIYTLVKDSVRLSPAVHTAAKICGYVDVLDLAFGPKRLSQHITEASQSSGWKKIKATVLAASEVGNIAFSASEAIQALKETGLLAAKTFGWTRRFSYAYLPSQILSLGHSIQQASLTRSKLDIANSVTLAASTVITCLGLVYQSTPLMLALYTVTTLSSFALTVIHERSSL